MRSSSLRGDLLEMDAFLPQSLWKKLKELRDGKRMQENVRLETEICRLNLRRLQPSLLFTFTFNCESEVIDDATCSLTLRNQTVIYWHLVFEKVSISNVFRTNWVYSLHPFYVKSVRNISL